MIRYTLRCDEAHEFEGWFANSAAYDKQRKRKLIGCPDCGSTHIEKAMMAPNVVTSEKAAGNQRPTEVPMPASPPAPPQPARLAFSPEQREMLKQLRRMRDEVLSKSEDVGARFADEARRIHNKETPDRGIHGTASVEDVKALHDDGIEVYPVPELPDDKN